MKRFILITGIVIATLFLAKPAVAAEVTPMPQNGWWEVSVLGGHSLSCPLTVELWRGEHLIGAQNLAPFPASPPPVMMSLPPGPPLPIPEPLSLGKIHASYPLEIKFKPSGGCQSDLNFVNENNAVFAEMLPVLDDSGEQLIGWLAGWAGLDPFWLIELNLEIKPIDLPVNPAVFIHGLGGHSTDWTEGNKSMYWERLDQEGWPQSYRASYAYADADGDPQTYDYQGDIREIENNLPDLVNQLAGEYVADGGDCSNGCVDLVGFSLGGMVAREYLNENPFDHKVRKLVTIGSPHRGVGIPSLKDWIRDHNLEGTAFEDAIAFVANALTNSVRDVNGQPLDSLSPAVGQISPRSEFITTFIDPLLNTKPRETHLLYGDIDAELKTELFFFELKKRKSYGDLLISVESATGAPFDNKQVFGVSDDSVFGINFELKQLPDQGYTFEADFADPSEFRLRHTELPKQPEMVDKVFDILTIR